MSEVRCPACRDTECCGAQPALRERELRLNKQEVSERLRSRSPSWKLSSDVCGTSATGAHRASWRRSSRWSESATSWSGRESSVPVVWWEVPRRRRCVARIRGRAQLRRAIRRLAGGPIRAPSRAKDGDSQRFRLSPSELLARGAGRPGRGCGACRLARQRGGPPRASSLARPQRGVPRGDEDAPGPLRRQDRRVVGLGHLPVDRNWMVRSTVRSATRGWACIRPIAAASHT